MLFSAALLTLSAVTLSSESFRSLRIRAFQMQNSNHAMPSHPMPASLVIERRAFSFDDMRRHRSCCNFRCKMRCPLPSSKKKQAKKKFRCSSLIWCWPTKRPAQLSSNKKQHTSSSRLRRSASSSARFLAASSACSTAPHRSKTSAFQVLAKDQQSKLLL